MCLFSGGFGALNPPGKVFFLFFFCLSTIWSLPLFKTKTPGGVKPGWSYCLMPGGGFIPPPPLWLWFLHTWHQRSIVLQSCSAEWGQWELDSDTHTSLWPPPSSLHLESTPGCKHWWWCAGDGHNDDDNDDDGATLASREQQSVYCIMNVTTWWMLWFGSSSYFGKFGADVTHPPKKKKKKR